MDDMTFMRRAIELSASCAQSDEGPFGAVVVKDGKIIGEGVNQVVPAGDPTAHAEIVAIRAACEAIGSHVLDGAVVYTSCEPCPMCLSAAWWARVSEIVYANTREDAAAIGFDDDAIYREVAIECWSGVIAGLAPANHLAWKTSLQWHGWPGHRRAKRRRSSNGYARP
jgi:guanine deaminase